MELEFTEVFAFGKVGIESNMAEAPSGSGLHMQQHEQPGQKA